MTATTSAAVGTGDGPTVRARWRAHRGPLLLGALLVVGSTLLALASLGGPRGALDPGSATPAGSRALRALLTDVGVDVRRVVPDASGVAVPAGATVLLPFPDQLAPEVLAGLAPHAGPVVAVSPLPDALALLGVPAEVSGSDDERVRRPACSLPAAARAGAVSLGGLTYEAAPATTSAACYALRGQAPLLRVDAQGPRTLLGSGTFLTNDALDEQGHAALALGLLAERSTLVWVMPAPFARDDSPREGVWAVLPDGVRGAALTVCGAGLLLVLARARRLGRVVEEPLPVVVRASEAVEGHGRLAHLTRDRTAAASALRADTRARLLTRLGLPGSADREAVLGAVEAVGGDPAATARALYGPDPADDDALLTLAHDLDTVTEDLP